MTDVDVKAVLALSLDWTNFYLNNFKKIKEMKRFETELGYYIYKRKLCKSKDD